MSIPSPSYSIKLRVEITNRVGMLGRLTTAIGEAGGDIAGVDQIKREQRYVLRDITVNCASESHARTIIERVSQLPGINLLDVRDLTFEMHLGGKIAVHSKVCLLSQDDLSKAYTPGVARVCRAIAGNKDLVFKYTAKANSVAVVTDGTAVLGLGDIGPEAALPVMEGKCMLFKEFAGVDAFPICLATKDTQAIVETVRALSPGFGGINLEDISAPRCFEIEQKLQDALDIPVFHDDQHGTAVVVLAALMNALKIVGKKLEALKVVIVGTGAAGVAITKILLSAGCKNIIGCDRQGAIYFGRADISEGIKLWYAENTNPERLKGAPDLVVAGADILIGVSVPGSISPEAVNRMAKDAIVFALANPEPEIRPEQLSEKVAIIATGRSDYPNQINNVLCFPGIFRGALDAGATKITEGMKLAAARAISQCVSDSELSETNIVPSPLNRNVAKMVARAVADAARLEGVCRSAATTSSQLIYQESAN
jgi:malate dehydrogenase (oxaloacetate-decarboxylating)